MSLHMLPGSAALIVAMMAWEEKCHRPLGADFPPSDVKQPDFKQSEEVDAADDLAALLPLPCAPLPPRELALDTLEQITLAYDAGARAIALGELLQKLALVAMLETSEADVLLDPFAATVAPHLGLAEHGDYPSINKLLADHVDAEYVIFGDE